MKSPAESWMGWSNGRWEGDTLVVDVTSLMEDTWFDRAGNFHSDCGSRKFGTTDLAWDWLLRADIVGHTCAPS